MTEMNYKPRKPSKIMKLFWKAAGGDAYILSKTTYADQIKYFCLGGIVIATAVMAGLSGGYAFYTIFKPKAENVSNIWEHTNTEGALNNLQGYTETTDFTTALIAIVFAIIWGLIIYNIDRFIVTSTGKGDGTEAITWGELKNAFPRIIMGCIIAISISKPLEIRILKGEIDAKLQVKQEDLRAEQVKNIEAKYADRFKEQKTKVEEFRAEIDKAEDAYTAAEKEFNNELAEKPGGSASGYGPDAKRKEQLMFDRRADRDQIRQRIEPLIAEVNEKIKDLEQDRRKEIDKISFTLSGLDGLAERITIAEEEYFEVSIFLTLLFLAIELTPIFFKLMLIKSPYDYLSDNYKELELANNGIYVDSNYVEDENGVQKELIRYLNAEKQISEHKEIQDLRMRLTQYAVEKFEEQERKKIDENPEDYIKYS